MPALTEPSTNPPTPLNLPKKSWFRRHPILATILAIPMLVIGSCSFHYRDRTVVWEEEVPLNTGETIWVKRSVPWSLQGGAGNPLAISMKGSISRQIIEFTYGGKPYSYSRGAWVGWIVIAPDGKPNLIARSGGGSWGYLNRFPCVTPSYVQFQPDSDGKSWTWLKNMEPWLYGMRYNVMAKTNDMLYVNNRRLTVADRNDRDVTFQTDSRLKDGVEINPNYSEYCPIDASSIKSSPESNPPTSTTFTTPSRRKP